MDIYFDQKQFRIRMFSYTYFNLVLLALLDMRSGLKDVITRT